MFLMAKTVVWMSQTFFCFLIGTSMGVKDFTKLHGVLNLLGQFPSAAHSFH